MASQVIYKVTVKTTAWTDSGAAPGVIPSDSLIVVKEDIYDNITKIDVIAAARPSLLLLKDKNGNVALLRPMGNNTIVEAESREVPVILEPDKQLVLTGSDKVH